MKSFNILTICLLCLVFFSCDAGHNKVLPVKFGQVENLVAVDSVDIETYDILNPVKIVSSEDSIWMVEDGRSEDCCLPQDNAAQKESAWATAPMKCLKSLRYTG